MIIKTNIKAWMESLVCTFKIPEYFMIFIFTGNLWFDYLYYLYTKFFQLTLIGWLSLEINRHIILNIWLSLLVVKIVTAVVVAVVAAAVIVVK